MYIHSTNLTALPEVQLPYFLCPGSEAACPPQSMPILFLHTPSHPFYQIRSFFPSHFVRASHTEPGSQCHILDLCIITPLHALLPVSCPLHPESFMEGQVLLLPRTRLKSFTSLSITVWGRELHLCAKYRNTSSQKCTLIRGCNAIFFFDNEEKVITNFPYSASLRKRNSNVQLGRTPGTRGNGL